MKIQTLGLIGVSMLSAAAWADPTPAANCPNGLGGKWFCHAQGMPGDGSDETTFNLDVRVLTNTKKEILSYDLSGDLYPLGTWTKDVALSVGPNSGSTDNWYRSSRCDGGKLLTDYQSYTVDGKIDLPMSTELIEMDALDPNHMTIQQATADEVDTCARIQER